MKRNVGFIGFGFIGKVHALAYRSLPFYYDQPPGPFRFAAVATSREESAEHARKKYGFDRATTDWREIVDDPSIPIIHVAQPNAFHRDVLLAAIDAGKHIYCEKPLTATWEEALEVAARLPRYEGISQMCLQNRFFAATILAAELAQSGLLGEITAFRGTYLHSSILDPSRVLNWKASADIGGGGVINDLGPHILDLLQLWCGEFEEVLARTRITCPDRELVLADGSRGYPSAEDHAVLLLRLPSGVAGTCEVSKVAAGAEDDLRIEAHGTGGAMRFDLMSPHWLEVFDARQSERGWKRIPTGGNYAERGAVPGKMAVGWVRAHIASLYNFLRAVERGEPAQPDLQRGVQLQALLGAAYRSARDGGWRPVPRAGGSGKTS